MSYFGESDPRSRSSLLVLIVGVLAGVLVMALAWFAHARTSSDDSAHESGPAPAAPSGSGVTAQPAPSAAPSNESVANQSSDQSLSRCQAVFVGQQRPLTAASASMAQWQVHIGAMNKLVVGAITLQQATQFWNQTRVGAREKLTAFAGANRRFAQRTVRCPPPSVVARSDQTLASCSRAVAARGRVLHLARVALDTWRMHVHHMEMLRDGTMSPQRATTLWLHSWHQGQAQVNAYRAAVRRAQDQLC